MIDEIVQTNSSQSHMPSKLNNNNVIEIRHSPKRLNSEKRMYMDLVGMHPEKRVLSYFWKTISIQSDRRQGLHELKISYLLGNLNIFPELLKSILMWVEAKMHVLLMSGLVLAGNCVLVLASKGKYSLT